MTDLEGIGAVLLLLVLGVTTELHEIKKAIDKLRESNEKWRGYKENVYTTKAGNKNS